MSTSLSLHQMLTQLETRIADHRAQLAFHAGRQQFHEEQKALHEAELQSALERYETLRTASQAAGQFLDQPRPGAAPPAIPEVEIDPRKGSLSRMIATVLEARGPGEVFGPNAVTEEIRRRWGAKLRRKVDPRSVSATLRRWATAGRLEVAREGRAHYETLYTRKVNGRESEA